MKRGFIISVLVMAFASAQAAPLDEQQVRLLLESGFSAAEVVSQIEKQGYAGGNDKATLQRLRTAGASAEIILLLAKAKPNQEKPPEKTSAPPATDFYQTGRPRVQLLMNNGKYGLMVKGQTVVEPEWDYWKKSFPGDDGAGTVTFSNISSAGYMLISKTRKETSAFIDAAMLEKPASVTSQSDITAYVNCYLLDVALRFEENKKVKGFDKSIQFTVPRSDDPRALLPFTVKRKGDIRGKTGLKLPSGETVFPPDGTDINQKIGLPAEQPVSQDQSILTLSAYGLKMPQLTKLAGGAAINLKVSYINLMMKRFKYVNGITIDPKLSILLFEYIAAEKILEPTGLALLKKWWLEDVQRDVLYVRFIEQLDSTYQAQIFQQKNTWPDIDKFFTPEFTLPDE